MRVQLKPYLKGGFTVGILVFLFTLIVGAVRGVSLETLFVRSLLNGLTLGAVFLLLLIVAKQVLPELFEDNQEVLVDASPKSADSVSADSVKTAMPEETVAPPESRHSFTEDDTKEPSVESDREASGKVSYPMNPFAEEPSLGGGTQKPPATFSSLEPVEDGKESGSANSMPPDGDEGDSLLEVEEISEDDDISSASSLESPPLPSGGGTTVSLGSGEDQSSSKAKKMKDYFTGMSRDAPETLAKAVKTAMHKDEKQV